MISKKWMSGKKKERSGVDCPYRSRGRSAHVDMIFVLCKRCYDKEYKREYT